MNRHRGNKLIRRVSQLEQEGEIFTPEVLCSSISSDLRRVSKMRTRVVQVKYHWRLPQSFLISEIERVEETLLVNLCESYTMKESEEAD